MAKKLENFKVAFLAAHGVEESELTKPREALDSELALTHLISPEGGFVRSWRNGNWSNDYTVDIALETADHSYYDALVLPGGVMNPDTLRLYPAAIDFIKNIGKAGKPIAAICHGPWTLINAGLVKGKEMTSWRSIRVDLENAGAHWVDKPVVIDGQIVTSRKPDDIPVFNDALILLFSQSLNL